MTHTTPELLGLNNYIKTRSLRVIDFLNNNNLLTNNTNSNRIVAHVTVLSQNDFINPHEINQSFKKLFEKEKIGSMLSINLECWWKKVLLVVNVKSHTYVQYQENVSNVLPEEYIVIMVLHFV